MDRSSKGTAFIQWAEEVPADWSSVRLRNLLTSVLAGNWGYDPGESDVDLFCARITDFDWHRLEIRDERINTRRSYRRDHTDRLALESGDLLVEKSGGGEKHPVGRCVQYIGEGGLTFANFAMRLRVNESVSSSFLCYSLAASYFRGHSWKILNQTTGIQNLDVSAFRSSPIPLPPRVEQQQIVQFLDEVTAEIDGLVGKLEHEVELLERYRRELIAHTVTRGLDPDVPMKDSGIDWIGEVPEHWIVERVQWHMEKVDISNTPIITTQVLSLVKDKGVVPYEERGAKGNKAKTELQSYKVAHPDTIVMNSMNVIIGSVGISRYFGLVSPVYYVFKNKAGTSLEFLNYVFQTRRFQKELRKYANGILEIRLRVPANAVLKRILAFPPFSEQQQIATFLDYKSREIDSTISNINKQIELLGKYRKQIINDAVTGKVRVGEMA